MTLQELQASVIGEDGNVGWIDREQPIPTLRGNATHPHPQPHPHPQQGGGEGEGEGGGGVNVVEELWKEYQKHAREAHESAVEMRAAEDVYTLEQVDRVMLELVQDLSRVGGCLFGEEPVVKKLAGEATSRVVPAVIHPAGVRGYCVELGNAWVDVLVRVVGGEGWVEEGVGVGGGEVRAALESAQIDVAVCDLLGLVRRRGVVEGGVEVEVEERVMGGGVEERVMGGGVMGTVEEVEAFVERGKELRAVLRGGDTSFEEVIAVWEEEKERNAVLAATLESIAGRLQRM